MALFSIETHGQLHPHLAQEWLLTNGLGGFSSSSVVGCNTRRYHGLLCAALMPPVGRFLTLSHLGEALTLDGDPNFLFELSVNQFEQAFHPHGWLYLRKFELDDTARWEYDVEGVRISKEVQLLWRQNVVGIRYTLQSRRPRKVKLALSPFMAMRDFHGLQKSGATTFSQSSEERGVSVTAYTNTATLRADAGTFQSQPNWWYNNYYNIESDRGADATEDLYSPGSFILESADGAKTSITLWVTTDASGRYDWNTELLRRQTAFAAAHAVQISPPAAGRPVLASASQSPAIKALTRAANDFIVFRKMPSGEQGSTVIAGYPWFADWGRDTMISIPGLFLVTGRFEQAKQVLSVFAQYCSEGMIPNRFDDYTNDPSYNTVDASLWFIHAAFEYLRYSNDKATFDKILRPACQSILEGYRKGTRYNIKMDDADGLITQGDANTQLTWMDAKCNGVAFTPRQGKAVEINAMWYHALVLMGEKQAAARVAESFRNAFWLDEHRGLADVVDGSPGPGGYPVRDASLRPNQIFAVSLPNSPLNEDQQRAVVDVVRRELLTPVGLRSLNRGDGRYSPWYSGTQFQRDGRYHNGIVWAWLIGGYLSAFLRVSRNSPEAIDHARGWLQPLIDQMHTNCIGQVAEIYEAEVPHRMVGCPAQAWSVAETLRLAVELGM
ncbi:MAG TPA: amylo-alpha-1,6-glucosidase [Tepidisphaeraceae bacterium]|jgi:predicted glycogen debranching enzyme|nr:amylo-alpha-1,6-glucosidase [Tepidisphaeraceae bacterium]